MIGWLLDTNVVSQFAPGKDGKQRTAPELSAWIRNHTDQLFLSMVSVVEISAGIQKLRRAGAEQRADNLDGWFNQIIDFYGERILPISIVVAKMAGLLTDHARAIGRQPGLSDILIAATAEAHSIDLLTDNTRHFEPLRLTVSVLNPLERLPGASTSV